MLDVSNEIKVIKRGLLPFESVEFIFDLYLPLIGNEATFLYLFLMNNVKNNEFNGKLGDLIQASKMEMQSFILAKKTLESIGLLSFYENKKENKFLLIVNDAYTPKAFFTNLVLKGLFIQNCGEERTKKILEKYNVSINTKGYNDVSAKINDTFVIDFNSNFAEIDQKEDLVGLNKNTIKDSFSDVKLLNYLKKNTQIKINSLTEDEIDFIHKVATLYGMKEKDVGGLVADCFIPEEPIGNKIDRNKLKRNAKTYVRSYKISKNKTESKTFINSTSDVANLVNMYESISPRKFLMSKQNDVEPSDADKNLIEELSFEMGFSNGIINALLDYVLRTKSGELSKNYVLKIATTLIRKGCKNTLDCLNLLNPSKRENKSDFVKTNFDKTENAEISTNNLDDDESDDYKIFEE